VIHVGNRPYFAVQTVKSAYAINATFPSFSKISKGMTIVLSAEENSDKQDVLQN
jgi:DNA polymerase II small subunit/DNA polymerase delta subunit B